MEFGAPTINAAQPTPARSFRFWPLVDRFDGAPRRQQLTVSGRCLGREGDIAEINGGLVHDQRMRGKDRPRMDDRPGAGQAASGICGPVRRSGKSLMLAMRRRIRPLASNSQFSLPIAAKPIAAVIVPFIGEPHRDAVLAKGPELLDQLSNGGGQSNL
jgi:hypothetical protein